MRRLASTAPAAAPASPIAAAVRYVLVDTGTDLRAQALAYNVRRVDAILFTHSHADHIMGLDEVRRYNMVQQTAIGCYARPADAERPAADVLVHLRRRAARRAAACRKLSLFEIGGPFSIGGVEVVPVPLMHGPRPILGYRVGSFAYLTDCNHIPDRSWPLLEGVDTLVLDALRDRPHSTHFSVDRSAAGGRAPRPRTHLLHAHLPRSAARRHLCAAPGRRGVGL